MVCVELGFEADVAVLEPGGADDGFDELGFERSLRRVLAVKVFGELGEFGGVFAGDDAGGGVQSMLHGVEAGHGLALDGAGAGGVLGVHFVDCGGCHTTPCYHDDTGGQGRFRKFGLQIKEI